jgi:hypothetical protein
MTDLYRWAAAWRKRRYDGFWSVSDLRATVAYRSTLLALL